MAIPAESGLTELRACANLRAAVLLGDKSVETEQGAADLKKRLFRERWAEIRAELGVVPWVFLAIPAIAGLVALANQLWSRQRLSDSTPQSATIAFLILGAGLFGAACIVALIAFPGDRFQERLMTVMFWLALVVSFVIVGWPIQEPNLAGLMWWVFGMSACFLGGRVSGIAQGRERMYAELVEKEAQRIVERFDQNVVTPVLPNRDQ